MPLKTMFAVLTLSFSNLAYCEIIHIPLGQQGTDANLSTPTLGQSEEAITTQFGEPLRRITAIGEPPISHWVYEEFTVYFEGDRVIHSVKKFIATDNTISN